ncbi:MAG: M20/M25/M40 family metallo-hydrolase [Patescibacteria group bacterium]
MTFNFTEFVNLLKEYVGYKSVSTDKAFSDGITATVVFLKSLFEKNDFKVSILQGPNTNPVVLASYHKSNNLKTKLIYGHYDVQPALTGGGWKGDPFVLREEDGRLIGRGVMDNKAQNLIHIFTALKLIKNGTLGCNVKFLIEGNEETQNPDMADLVLKHADELKCDEIIVSDGEILGSTPCIEESLRGGGNITLTFKTAKNNLHSGVYGSGIPNSAKEMTAFLAKMLLPHGRVAIPEFYDSVDPISQEKVAKNKAMLEIDNPLDVTGAKKTIGIHDFHTMVGVWPAMEISGLLSGYTGEGYSNIIPGETMAKINVRLVASQTSHAFEEMFRRYVEDNVPDSVDYTISMTKFSPPVKVDVTSPEIQRIMWHQKRIYGKKPIVKNVGGGIPIVADFKEILGVDAFLIPLGCNDSNMHGDEENMQIDLLQKGLELSEQILMN